jgi:hypothetical protein
VIGLVFLVIVLVSPAGAIGLWEKAVTPRRRRGTEAEDAVEDRGSRSLTPAG